MITFENDRRTRAEARLLGALLLDAGAIRHCQTVKPVDFSHELHGAIFSAIRLLLSHDRPVNAVSVLGVMMLHHRAPRFDVFPYLLTLLAQGGVPAHTGYYAAIMLGEVSGCASVHGDAPCRERAALASFYAVDPFMGQPR